MLPLAEQPTPALREDLRLCAAGDSAQGEPAWVIHDTVTNRFYRIGWLEFECLLRWGQSARQICEQIGSSTALDPDVEQVLEFRRFLEQHQLLRDAPQTLSRLRAQGEHGIRWLSWNWWLHHYLFFRIPLLHPQQPLHWLARQLAWLFSPVTALLVGALSLLGIILVLHQWDTFTQAVVESFSTEGLLSFALALIIAKTLHELGHALVATRLGLRVGHMGIAFVVLWPMLYTDTGESWKLRSARQRLAIACAGIVTELSLAGLATLGWALCDPGAVRNGLLYLATTSWVLSLALNASPFMRFDGYFILSDLLDFPNLHERASALARVSLRRSLLGLNEPWPELFSRSRRRLLITFAFVTWLYRLVVFLGIAYAVYLLFFKLLGIVLFAVELSWFVAMPVIREFRYCWRRRQGVPHRRRWLLAAFTASLLLVLVVPWRSQIDAYGVAHAARQLRVYAPVAARLQSITEQGAVHAGQALARLDDPQLTAQALSSDSNARSYEARLSGLIADPAGVGEQTSTRQRLLVQQAEAAAARSQISRLTLSAPFAGEWRDTNPELSAGQWVSSREPLGILIDPANWQVDGYVPQDEVQRLGQGDAVLFFPEGQSSPLHGRVLMIGSTRATQLAHRMLGSRFGGPIATVPQEDGVASLSPLFHVVVQLDPTPTLCCETRGRLKLTGQRQSVLEQVVKHLIATYLKESGF